MVVLGYYIHKLYTQYHEKRHQKIIAENNILLELKELENEQKIMKIKNEQLIQDVDKKNKELAVSTMNLIKKTELLNIIKADLKNSTDSTTNRSIKSVISTINKNVKEENTWNIFKEAFDSADNNFLKKVRERCTEVGALMILDEIQPGFGRTGKLFGFQNYDVVPDIVVMGKGMGGGMPVGAFTASSAMMDLLSENPKLGHITTFGGHPVIASACLATLQEITETNLMSEAIEKEKLFRSLLVHPLIEEIRGKGLMLAAMTKSADITNEVILKCQDKGLILFWLLFEGCAIRITPPLTISEEEIREGCSIILEVMDEILNKN